MSENISQKKGSNQGKTRKKVVDTSQIVEFSADGLDSTSNPLQCEIAHKKSKKKRVKPQKNETATTQIDKNGCKIMDQKMVVDGLQELKIGDGACAVKNENEKPPKKKNRLLDMKKNKDPSTSFLENITRNVESALMDDDLQISNDGVLVTNEGNKKTLKKKRRLEDAKEKNELETICPEKIIKSVECEMADSSHKPEEEDNTFQATEGNEEKPKKRRRRRNNKNKSPLESSSSGKLIKDSVESIVYTTSNHGNTQNTDYNQESRFNANKTVDIRATIKRKHSADSDKEIERIFENAPSEIDVIDSKQAIEIETSSTASTMNKIRKRNKNKSKNEEQTVKVKEDLLSMNKDCKIEGENKSGKPLSREMESTLSERNKPPDNCTIPNNKSKRNEMEEKIEKTTSNFAVLSDKVDEEDLEKRSTKNTEKHHNKKEKFETETNELVSVVEMAPLPQSNESNSSPNSEATSKNSKRIRRKPTTPSSSASPPPTPPDEIKLASEKSDPVEILEQGHKKCKKSKSKKNQFCFKDGVQMRDPIDDAKVFHEQENDNNKDVAKLKRDSEMNRKVVLASEQVHPGLGEKSMEVDKSYLKIHEELVKDQNGQKISKSKKKQQDSEVGEIPSKQPDDKSDNILNGNVEVKYYTDHMDPELYENAGEKREPHDDNKKKKSKSKNKKHNIPQIVTTDSSNAYNGTEGGEKSLVLEADAGIEEMIKSPSKETTENSSTVEVETTEEIIFENNSKKCISNYCSEPIKTLDDLELHGQENEDENQRYRCKFKKEKQNKNKIDKGNNNSNKIQVPITHSITENNQFSSLGGTASTICHNHDNSMSNQRDSVPESHNVEAARDYTLSTTLQQLDFFDMQKYDLFAISEAEKRFAKLLESGYDTFKNNCISELSTELDINSSNDNYTRTTESDTDSTNNNYTRNIDELHINHFEDNVKEIPDEIRTSNPDLQSKFSEKCSSNRTSNCDEKPYNSQCALSWSEVAAREVKTKSEDSHDHASENQQNNIQKSLESTKPVYIIVAERPSRADNDIATVDSEGFVKIVSKIEMRKQRSRTSSRNDEQEVAQAFEQVAQAFEEIQNETSINTVEKSNPNEESMNQAIDEIHNETPFNIVKKSHPNERSMIGAADESNSLKPIIGANTVQFISETGVWMDKWKYHDAEVKFFESKEKIINTPTPTILEISTSDNDDNEGSSFSEPHSPPKGKRRKSRRKKRNKDKDGDKEPHSDSAIGTDDSSYISDEDAMNLNSRMATTPVDSNQQDNTFEDDSSDDETDTPICNRNQNPSQKIRQLFVMILMELYFMLIYYASGFKKKKKVE